VRCLVHALILVVAITVTTVGAPAKAIAQDGPADSVQGQVWAGEGKQVFFRIADEAYYFNNDSDRLCYTFRIKGNWHPGGPGLWRSEDGNGFAGVAVVSMQQLQSDAASLGVLKQYDGSDLINRTADVLTAIFEKRIGRPPTESTREPYSPQRTGTVKWSAHWQQAPGNPGVTANRILLEITPGWVAQLTAEGMANRDALLSQILETLSTTAVAECYRPFIRQYFPEVEKSLQSAPQR
jgi:hypothetical protein